VTTDGRHLMSSGRIPVLAPEILTQVIASASDIALLISPKGRIDSVIVNPQHRFFGQLGEWEGMALVDVLSPESQKKFAARQADTKTKGQPILGVELNHSDAAMWAHPVRYSVHQIAEDGTTLMLGRDLRLVAEVQQQLVTAQLALERDYEAQREADTRYRVLMEVAHDSVVLVSVSSGRIIDLSQAASGLLGGTRVELTGVPFAQEFDGRRRGELLEGLANLASSERRVPMELTARRSTRRMLVTPTLFRAAGERILLCQLELISTTVARTDDLHDGLTQLYNEGVDGIVFADADGNLRAANEAFLNLTDTSNFAAIRGRSLADFLARGDVDLRLLLDNVKRTGQLKFYATRLNTDFSGQVAVELSATWLNDRPDPILVLVVRDASRAEAMRRSHLPGHDEGTGNVMELVGSSPLKDIVAETTDVIEKMCIETALELTRNNRVAAADLLGLSRQSLYVKLRKFGLINRDDD
jgi:transcriptional regulator PpsR